MAGPAEVVGPDPLETQRLDNMERQAILQTLQKQGFNRTESAKALGISRRALPYKLQRRRAVGYDVDGPVGP